MKTQHLESRSTESSLPLAGLVAIAATYVIFLLWAQFGFLDRLQEAGASTGEIERAMIAMGLAGLVTSFATARLLPRFGSVRLLVAGFLASGVTTGLAMATSNPRLLAAVAAVIGVGLGLSTVALAADLTRWLPRRRFAEMVGWGTGLAYFVCNVPTLFEASPSTRAGFSGAVALAAALVVALASNSRGHMHRGANAEPDHPALAAADLTGWGLISLVLSFLALVWLDSAAFAIIQETAPLKDPTWGSAGHKWLQGSVHLTAAVAAGRLIDRGAFRQLLLGAYGLFVVAFGLLEQGLAVAWSGPIYAVGISTYSVALVAFPSLGPGSGPVPRRWRAALVYGVAGWIGSALGVGMAQDLHHIPVVFLAASGALLLAGVLLRSGSRFRLPPALGLTALWGLPGLLLLLAAPSNQATTTQPGDPDLGRRVYIAEGCIHCHSQYLRPRSRDRQIWGPGPKTGSSNTSAAAPTPPLYGNRRQGPDLTTVGNRRSATWQRLHLIDPRDLTPGSRMPAYAHLFDDRRGDDLVAYLGTLGSLVADQRWQQTRSLPINLPAGSSSRGGTLFQRICSPCHGSTGRGDGPLREHLQGRAVDLRKGRPWLISWGSPGDEPFSTALGRLIRYGMPGTDMPGHETLSDQQLADLVAFVGPWLAPAGDNLASLDL